MKRRVVVAIGVTIAVIVVVVNAALPSSEPGTHPDIVPLGSLPALPPPDEWVWLEGESNMTSFLDALKPVASTISEDCPGAGNALRIQVIKGWHPLVALRSIFEACDAVMQRPILDMARAAISQGTDDEMYTEWALRATDAIAAFRLQLDEAPPGSPLEVDLKAYAWIRLHGATTYAETGEFLYQSYKENGDPLSFSSSIATWVSTVAWMESGTTLLKMYPWSGAACNGRPDMSVLIEEIDEFYAQALVIAEQKVPARDFTYITNPAGSLKKSVGPAIEFYKENAAWEALLSVRAGQPKSLATWEAYKEVDPPNATEMMQAISDLARTGTSFFHERSIAGASNVAQSGAAHLNPWHATSTLFIDELEWHAFDPC